MQLSNLEEYKRQQNDLVKKYDGQIIAFKDGEVLGTFPTKVDALAEMKKQHPAGTYLIIKCTPGDEEYTRRFRSRAYFTSFATA